MGEHTELMVKEWKIPREEQDEIAYRSHMNAHLAMEDGRLKAEIHPLDGFDHDLFIRPDTSMVKLATLPPLSRTVDTCQGPRKKRVFLRSSVFLRLWHTPCIFGGRLS